MGMLTGPLAGRFRVIAAGNRGTSRPAKRPDPYSIEQLAADLAGLMNRVDLPCSRLLGIWMSGWIAMALALAQPGRVNRGTGMSLTRRTARARAQPTAHSAPRDPRLRGSITERSARFRHGRRCASGTPVFGDPEHFMEA
jgi:pimeloyl-ACP methyl ester carboxylesterase